MARLKICPYCGGKHRKQSAFLRCERKFNPEKWKKTRGRGKK